MKYIYSFLFILTLAFSACKKGFLEEKPLDFLSTSNALVSYGDYNASIYNLYNLVRSEFYSSDENYPMDYIYGTDLVFDGQASLRRWTSYAGVMVPSGGADIPLRHWNNMYKIIAESNTVLSRLPGSALSAQEKILTEARARFFRAFAYRTLTYLYGGVPLVLEEISEPRFNFTRATKAEVLNQVILDLTFSAANLPAMAAVQKGEIHKLAASHLLAEVYLAAGQFQNAVTAASVVIDAPETDLMKTRFGTRSAVVPGDVYWDLFQKGNQNAIQNTEALWVVQFETDVPGGGSVVSNTIGSAMYERHHAPYFGLLRVNGGSPFLWPVGDYTGGRGIGWAISTKYFSNTIWQSDFNRDMRNANHNFVRNFVANNPASPLYGQVISTENPPAGVTVPSRPFYAYQSKVTTPFDHPANLYATAANYLLKSTAGGTYTDQYMFRLAETYLIRAEAYLGLQNTTKAAEDINVVRSRANATPVAPANVNIDYILDERMRELGVEEKRRLTLMRLSLLYNRVTRFNPYYTGIQPFHNLFPIPQAEIERNRESVMEQNPGYK
jgi:hypothetical protein